MQSDAMRRIRSAPISMRPTASAACCAMPASPRSNSAGIPRALKCAAFAASHGIPCVNHSYSYGINLAASLPFAAAIERTSLFEFQATPNEIRDALVPNAPKPREGMLRPPQEPGLGIEVDEEALRRFAVAD